LAASTPPLLLALEPPELLLEPLPPPELLALEPELEPLEP
jgi:hypothetical protein